MFFDEKQIEQVFCDFKKQRVLIVGDTMLDTYVIGRIERMSPEAPVPIVNLEKRFNRLGGAANVAQNIKALGAEAILCSVVGNDNHADTLLDLMRQHQLSTQGIIRSTSRPTTTKYRILNHDSQVLRIDDESTSELSPKEFDNLSGIINNLLSTQQINVVILQDYNKGVLSSNLIHHIVEQANKLHISVAVDPKKKNFLEYQNVTLFKPNLKELREGLQTHFADSIDGIEQSIRKAQAMLKCTYLMTTLSERGTVISEEGKDCLHLPAQQRNIVDVSGAGDTVLSVAALCLATKQKADVIAYFSNMAGGLVCEESGVVPINCDKLIMELKQNNKT